MNKYQEALEYIFAATNGGDGIVKEMNVLAELVDKATPKKPIDISKTSVTWGLCPVCKGEIRKLGGMPRRMFKGEKYCLDCGQALDWSDEE